MKLLVSMVAVTALAGTACENTNSKLEGDAVAGHGTGDSAQLASIEARLKAIETSLARREEALGFLEMAYTQQKRAQEQQEDEEADPDAVFAVDISGPVKAGQTEGPANAAVTIVKAFDFACPYCEKLNEPLHELVKEYDGKVRVVYMNLVVHPDTAQLAHQYSCAAAKQGKYLAWKDAFWSKGFEVYAQSGGRERSAMGEDNILKLSADVGLDVGKLKSDATGDECKKRIEEDGEELRKFRVSGTPGLFINGKFIGGAIPKQAFKEIIDEKLKIAEASNVPAGEYYAKEIMGKGVPQFRSKRDGARAAAEKQP